MKKALALILAASMSFGMAVSSFAAEATLDSNGNIIPDQAIGGEVATPTIKAKLPTFATSSLIFDIYNQLGTGQQIISQPMVFENQSVVPVELQLTAYTIATSSSDNITGVTTEATVKTGIDKNMLLWLNTATKTGDEYGASYTFPAYVENDHKNKVFTGYNASNGTTATTPADAITFTQMKRGVKAIENNGVISDEAIPADTLKDSNKLVLRFDGIMNDNDGVPWAANEKITITPTFKLVPKRLEVAPALTSTSSPSLAAMAPVAGAAVTIVSPIALNSTTLAVTDITASVSGGHAVIVKSASVAADKKTITVNLKNTSAVVGDTITISISDGTLFVGGAAPDSVTLTVVA